MADRTPVREAKPTRRRRRSASALELVVVGAGVLAVSAVAALSWRAAAVGEDHQAAAGATAELRAHVTLAHLWFEEAVAGDGSVEVAVDVYGNLDRSAELCRAMRDGGRTGSGRMMAMEGPEGRANLAGLCRQLARFRALTAERWLNREKTEPGTAEEGDYDRLFEEILRRSDRNSAFMQGMIEADQRFQRALDAVTALALAALFAGILVVVRRHRRVVEAKNTQLEGLAAIVESSEDAIITTSRSGEVVSWNPGAERLYGYTAGEAVGRPLWDLLGVDHPQEIRHDLERAIGGQRVLPYETTRSTKDGRTVHVSLTVFPVRGAQGHVTGAASIARDVSERRRAEEALARQALYDPLTGLANRALFRERLAQALEGAGHRDGRPAVLVVDLDGFKDVNDTLGHVAGDQLLVEVAARLAACVGPSGTTARLGGDEFAVLLEGTGRSGLDRTAERMGEACRLPLSLAGREVLPYASVGAAIWEPGQGIEGVLRNADAAMYAAKACGGNHHQVYEAATHDKVLGRLELASELRGAVERGEFSLRYQPIVVTGTGRTVGLEALVRWEHPRRGLVSPMEFIPVAEATGAIATLGRWVLRTACRQAVAWQQRYPSEPPLYVSVNVAASQLRDERLVAEVGQVVTECGLAAESLVLEITETSLVADFEETVGTLHQLKALGIKLSIDDFGTGYSSLTYLRRLPVDVVKIDRSFVQGIATDAHEWALAVAVIRLVKALGLQTVAEGVEGPAQLAHLRALGCEFAQGYYFARPQDVAGMEALLAGAESGLASGHDAHGAPAGVRRRA